MRQLISPRTELYNLCDDLSETNDIFSTNPGKAKELRAALLRTADRRCS